jgi:diacylglycerol kinase (ATP)
MNTTWLAVVNPSAGRHDGARERVRAALSDHGVEAEIHVSRSAAHIAELVTAAITSGFERFVAVGGDGTASLVADALLRHPWETPPVLAILPAGSGSDFVRTFGFSQQLEEAVPHLLGPDTYPIDVIVVEGSWGTRRAINAVDAGVLGATVRRAEGRLRKLGRLRYQAAFWVTLPRFAPGEVRITMGDRIWEGRAITIVLANGQFFGGGVNIAPRATLIDGLLDVQVFACSRGRALLLHPKAIKGQHLRDPAVRRFQAPEVLIETARPFPIEVDGDYLGETPVRVKVESGAILFKI